MQSSAHENHDNDEKDDEGGAEIEAHQEEGDDQDGHEGDAERLEGVGPHRQVLFVEDVEHRVRKHLDRLKQKYPF